MNRLLHRAGWSALAVLLFLPPAGHGVEASRFRYQASAYADKDGKAMREPEGVACNEDYTVVVADTGNGRLLRYTFDGEQFKGGDAIALPERAYPTRVQLGSKGEVYCLDARQHRILRVGAGGAAAYVELTGVPEPSKILVRSFRVDRGDNLYVVDPTGWRIVVTDGTGRYLRQVPLPAGVVSADDLAVDPRGTVYLLDGVSGAIYVAAKDAESFQPFAKGLREFLNFSADLAAEPRGGLYLTDQNGGGIVFLGPDGTFQARHSSYGWKDGLLRHPAQLCVNDKGGLVVADRENSRIQLFLTR